MSPPIDPRRWARRLVAPLAALVAVAIGAPASAPATTVSADPVPPVTVTVPSVLTPPTTAASGVAPVPGCATEVPPVGAAFVDCAGGKVFNIVPPGQSGLSTVGDFAGLTKPAHQQDQRAMYADLLAMAPNLDPASLSRFYKDASFGTTLADADRVEAPRAGVVILRDRRFGVPHVFGVTRADVEFGSGYASAEDRLFMMDVLRHLGRAQLSSFIGPSPSSLAMDCGVARAAGYSEPELQQQFDRLATTLVTPFPTPTSATNEGQQIQQDGTAWVDGVNQYIRESLTDPSKLPVEYPALQQAPAPFKVTDIVATATLVQAIFATGGGGEVGSALLYRSLVQRYGQAQGASIWRDLRSQNDPEAQVSITTPFPYEQVPATVDPASLAMPLAPPTSSSCDGGPLPAVNPGLGQVIVGPVTVDLSGLAQAIVGGGGALPHASNELIVDAAHSATGHPIAVFGPQTGYFAPEILHEIDLHGPGIQARGVSFPGTEIYVELGRGVDYAWSATSAGADIVDQRIERLCNTDGSPATSKSTAYVFNGKCTPMYERTDRQVAKTSASAPNPPAVITIQIERTVHGPVIGRTTALDPQTHQPVPVAVSSERSTFFDELGAAAAFLEWNDPDLIHGPVDFQRAAGKETGTFNWTYVDSRDIAYYMSGKLPVRSPVADPNFPVWGTGQWDWAPQYVPTDLSAADLHPRAINPPSGFFTNWNNKPAPGFSAADDNYSYGPVYRVQSLADRVRAVISSHPATPTDIVNAMEDAGSVDLDGAQLVRQVAKVLDGASLTPVQRQALDVLQTWVADPFWGPSVPGAHRRDRSGSGAYEQGNAVAIMDALYPRLTHAVFDPWLDAGQYRQLASLNAIDNPPGATGSSYDGGWEGYLQRSLDQSLGQASAPYSQSYCGDRATCRSAVQKALQEAIDQLSATYGSPNPTAWSCARSNPRQGRSDGAGQTSGVACNPAFDDIQFSAVGVEKVPGMPWVNRPTFQQVVQFPAGRPPGP
ncbi:MAG: penicillin acylase family protein [Acidimicrobiales bacterium]